MQIEGTSIARNNTGKETVYIGRPLDALILRLLICRKHMQLRARSLTYSLSTVIYYG